MAVRKKKDDLGCSITPKNGYFWKPLKKTKQGEPGRWGPEKRMEAVTTFIATGCLGLTAKLTGIAYQTLYIWKQKEWWKEQLEQIYESDNIKLSARLTKTLDKTLSVLDERLQNGDYLWDSKSQRLVRVPVKLRDATAAANSLIDKRAILRKQPTKITQNNESTNARLDKLAEAFTSFAKGKATERIVNEIDGEFEEVVDAISEERSSPV